MSDEKETPSSPTPVAPTPAPRHQSTTTTQATADSGEVLLRTVWPSGTYTFTPESGGESVTATSRGVRVSRAVADAAVESTKAKHVYTKLAIQEVK